MCWFRGLRISLWKIRIAGLLFEQSHKHLGHHEFANELVVTVRPLIVIVFLQICIVHCHDIAISRSLIRVHSQASLARVHASSYLLVLLRNNFLELRLIEVFEYLLLHYFDVGQASYLILLPWSESGKLSILKSADAWGRCTDFSRAAF